MMKWIFYFLVLLTCTSCSTEVLAPKASAEFFDLTKFLTDHYQDSQQISVTKSVVVGGSSEKQTIEDYPFYKDAISFEHYDINRAALFDKYAVDSTLGSDELTITHRALDPELKVQILQIKSYQDKVKEIFIQARAKSLLSDVDLDITFKPNVGYTLARRSKKIFQDTTVTLVEVEINK